MRINFLPEQKKGIEINLKSILLFLLFMIIVAGLGGRYFYLQYRINALENEINGINSQLKILRPAQREYQSLVKKIRSLEDTIKAIEEADYFWYSLLEELGNITPDYVMLQNVNLSEDNKINIIGIARDEKELMVFVNNLKKSELFEMVQLLTVRKSQDLSFQIKAGVAERRK
ncbi:PilN domain-containing protein [Halothermothrix orenii]|uniref:Tfp pilus assembly protein PilN n=1 Tax=Halothermothrix orenii (strain H 168 / OCM 544 / DSM 9562) TaxID=373903 RepID=B8D2D6_HALOH|nr:PilN domain-containing protein [Halothermothrix orenii]ACL69363.1 Tfp pilus assembly protein PilN [Halothermothrix orenii H 168]